MEKSKSKVSEISSARKKKIMIGIAIYLLGFVFLIMIGDSINRNPYTPLGFLASFSVLAGIIFTVWSLVKRDK